MADEGREPSDEVPAGRATSRADDACRVGDTNGAAPAAPSARWLDRAATLVLVALSVLLGIVLVDSLGWRLQHDTPLLHYVGYLIVEHDFVPYRDVYETSMPGTFLLHATIGRLVGWSDAAFRGVDLAWMTAMATVIVLITRRAGGRVAWAAVVLAGLTYLGPGGSMSLQRDVVAMLPVAVAMWLALAGTDRVARPGTTLWIAAAIGACFGLAASVKPHLAIGAPVVVLAACRWRAARPPVPAASGRAESRASRPRRARRTAGIAWLWSRPTIAAIACSLAAFVACVGLPLLWVWARGGFDAFWIGFTEYLPLHLRLDGEHRTVNTIERIGYALRRYPELGGQLGLVPAAVVGLWFAFEDGAPSPRRRLGALLAVLAPVYTVYPVLSGQFWTYHWMPFAFMACLAAGLLLAPRPPATPRHRTLTRAAFPVAILVVTVLIAVRPPQSIRNLALGRDAMEVKGGRPDAIAAYLREHLEPGDRVQPLDWTGGAVHGMLMADAVLATPYICDYHFYHHVSEPAVQRMRAHLIDRFDAVPPRFVVRVEQTPRPYGRDAVDDFPALDARLERDYDVVLDGVGFAILERRTRPEGTDPR